MMATQAGVQKKLCMRLDHITVAKDADLERAMFALQFHWNLAQSKGETIFVEVWQKVVQHPPQAA